ARHHEVGRCGARPCRAGHRLQARPLLHRRRQLLRPRYPRRMRSYSGYHKRDVPEPDPELTRVGPHTPCGEWLRRSWQPVALASEVGATPLALRALGEDLVLFRDRSGRWGLLHRHCSHRGASLEYAIVLERGISCCYHGWHYDVDGTIIDTPAEPGERIRSRLVHGAYPVEERNGVVFAYLGPPELRPAAPVFD